MTSAGESCMGMTKNNLASDVWDVRVAEFIGVRRVCEQRSEQVCPMLLIAAVEWGRGRVDEFTYTRK